MSRKIVTDGTHVPEPVKELPYWVMWDFQEKQPRAPWVDGHSYKCEWKQDGDTNPRTGFTQANATVDLGPGRVHRAYPFPETEPERIGATLLLPHAGDDTPGPALEDPPLLFVDYDDVIDKSDGTIPDEVWDTAKDVGGPLFVSRSYNDESKEYAGLHQLARGTLPGSVTTLNEDFDTRGHVEVYKQSRMTGFTWGHVRGSPKDELPNATDAISEIVEKYGSDSTKDRANRDPSESADTLEELTPREDLEDMDTTDDMDDVFSAIKQIEARDITLRSTVTEERSGGRKSYDPSWEQSNSGTRLGYDKLNGGMGWIYRKANQPVDALQVVAAEERITTRVTNYPSGDDFWEAVERLRDRGANIPRYEGHDGKHKDLARAFEKAETKEEKRRRALRAMRASE